jgi:SAM-dependent methyltransferase
MAHEEQITYCNKIKNLFPDFFKNKKVLDVGSLDINGCNRYLFENCEYTGIDVGVGRNVDIVSKCHEFNAPDETYDVIISTECFEHDPYFKDSFKNITRMLKTGGMLIFTCATTGRPEHGTIKTSPNDSPLTISHWGDYYHNITFNDIKELLKNFSHIVEFNYNHCDLMFYGFKK